ncbi:rhodanese-like domain-containing protein, partial [Thermoproteota archaeon]
MEKIRNISREELLNLYAAKTRFKVVDVLSREHYEKEHIEGAISLPLDEIEEKAKGTLEKNDLIVVYC